MTADNWLCNAPLIVLLALLQGCSYQWVDKQGNHRVIGLVNMTVPSEENTSVPQQVSVTSIGISGLNLPSHGGLSIGYSRNTVVSMPDNSLYLIDQIRPGSQQDVELEEMSIDRQEDK